MEDHWEIIRILEYDDFVFEMERKTGIDWEDIRWETFSDRFKKRFMELGLI